MGLAAANLRTLHLIQGKKLSNDWGPPQPIPLNDLNSIGEVAPVDPIVRQELSQQLDRALAALPAEQRSAFVLAEIEELPYAEIARIERTSLGTVKSRIHRAKQRLQSLLDPAMRESK